MEKVVGIVEEDVAFDGGEGELLEALVAADAVVSETAISSHSNAQSREC